MTSAMFRTVTLLCALAVTAICDDVVPSETALASAYQRAYGVYTYYNELNIPDTMNHFCEDNNGICSPGSYPDYCLVYRTTCVSGWTPAPSVSYYYSLYHQSCTTTWCTECQDSYQHYCLTTTTPPTTAAPSTTSGQSKKCEYSRYVGLGSRVGGTTTTDLQCHDPWIVVLRHSASSIPFCSGIIVNSQKVITTAECLSRVQIFGSGADITMTVGEYAWQIDNQFGQQTVTSSHISENSGTGLVTITLRHPLGFNGCVSPACFQYQDSTISVDTKSCKIVGWGETSQGPPILPSDVINVGNVNVAPDCSDSLDILLSMFPGKFDIGTTSTHNMGCTSPSHSAAAACDGDVGGPVTCEEITTGERIVVGLMKNGTCHENYHLTFFVKLDTIDSEAILRNL